MCCCFVNNRVAYTLFLASSFVGLGHLSARSPDAKEWFYICSFSKEGHGGIHLGEFDHSTGELRVIRLVAQIKNTSFAAIHPNGEYLYATSKIDEREDLKNEALSAFRIDRKTGDLKLLNHQPSAGANPCHIGFDNGGKHAFVSNFDGGNVAVLPIAEDGRLGFPTSVVLRSGSTLDGLQARPHPHQVVLDAGNRFAYVPDLGLDKILTYRYDAVRGTLLPSSASDFKAVSGAGPRHFAFHSNDRWAYLVNQLNSTITSFQYDSETGKLTATDVKPTLPNSFKLQNDAAEIVIQPGGEFLYVSNRGHDSIEMFLIDRSNGQLTNLGWQPAGGRTPTSICFDLTGKYLLSANLDSNNIVVHEVNPATGRLSKRQSCEIAKPSFILLGTIPTIAK